MKLTKTKTTTEEIEISAPAYLQFGCHFAKVCESGKVITVCTLKGLEEVEVRDYLSGNDWQPVDAAKFYESFATVTAYIVEMSGLESLTLEIEKEAVDAY
jgi:hypothetical protein